MSFEHYTYTTILAIILGPILAVFVTRLIDEERAKQKRKLDVFRILMGTIYAPFDRDHVRALNSVMVEFTKHAKVIQAWEAYMEYLGNYDMNIENRNKHIAKLIFEIANALKIKIKALDILEKSYYPQVLFDEDNHRGYAWKGLSKVVHGESLIIVEFRQPKNPSEPEVSRGNLSYTGEKP